MGIFISGWHRPQQVWAQSQCLVGFVLLSLMSHIFYEVSVIDIIYCA